MPIIYCEVYYFDNDSQATPSLSLSSLNGSPEKASKTRWASPWVLKSPQLQSDWVQAGKPVCVVGLGLTFPVFRASLLNVQGITGFD